MKKSKLKKVLIKPVSSISFHQKIMEEICEEKRKDFNNHCNYALEAMNVIKKK